MFFTEFLGYPVQDTGSSEKIELQEDYSAASSNSSESTEQKPEEATSQALNFEDTKSSETEHESSFGRFVFLIVYVFQKCPLQLELFGT